MAKLFEEHARLVDKKFDDGLSPKETARLGYVRWQLDRIEDAKVGAGLDALEALAELQASIADEVERFLEQSRTTGRPARKKR